MNKSSSNSWNDCLKVHQTRSCNNTNTYNDQRVSFYWKSIRISSLIFWLVECFLKIRLPVLQKLVLGLFFHNFFKMVFAKMINYFALKTGSPGEENLLLLFVPFLNRLLWNLKPLTLLLSSLSLWRSRELQIMVKFSCSFWVLRAQTCIYEPADFTSIISRH